MVLRPVLKGLKTEVKGFEPLVQRMLYVLRCTCHTDRFAIVNTVSYHDQINVLTMY